MTVDDSDGSNAAFAENQNRHFDVSHVPTDIADTETLYSGNAGYALTAPSSVIDESATVTDPGLVCPTQATVRDLGHSQQPGMWIPTRIRLISMFALMQMNC